MADSAALAITVDGTTHTVRFEDLTAEDAKAFRSKVGISLAKVMAEESSDLDVVAGLIWLARRRREPALTYEQVAKSLNYGSDLEIASPNGSAPEDEGPEASGGPS